MRGQGGDDADLPAFLCLSLLKGYTERNYAEHKSGDCQQRIEQFYVGHDASPPLHLYADAKEDHPVGLPAYKDIVADGGGIFNIT